MFAIQKSSHFHLNKDYTFLNMEEKEIRLIKGQRINLLTLTTYLNENYQALQGSFGLIILPLNLNISEI